jgi:DNA invertase Pin-like site-specific DNA recombinase
LLYALEMAKRVSDRVLAYLRVSTEEQALSGLGLADQRKVIEQEAAHRNWSNVEFVVDEGYSAKSLARPGIHAALEQLSRGQAGVLVVSKLDRLSRSLLDFAGLMDRAKREGWRLVVLDLALDTTTASGALMANVMASFAEYERRLIADRTSAALQAKKAQGARLGRPRVTSSDVLERVREERAAGGSLRVIADGLNQRGVLPSQGGKRWYASTVASVLRSDDLDVLAQAARTGAVRCADA